MKTKRKFIILSMLLSASISLIIIYHTYLHGIEYVFAKHEFFYYFILSSFLSIFAFCFIIILDKINNDKICNINKFIREFNQLYNIEYELGQSHENIENLEKSILLLKNNTIETIDALVESLALISKSHKDLSSAINNDLLLKMKNKSTLH